MEPSVGPAPTGFCCSTAAKNRFLMIKKSHKFLERILPFAVFGALWYLLIRHLFVYWNLNPQYSYGWFAPVICAYLFFIRWFTRPSPGPALSRGAQWVFWIAAFALLPTWVVEQPNPDWRLLSWLLTLEIVTLSLCAIYFVGGKSWLKHFGFSVCFILFSVPWPGTVEDFIIRELTQMATLITVASLNLFHIWALQHGNLVEVKTGLLGIDEACSGIRSLEATLMVSLFLGELYRTNLQRRVLLMFCGVIIAFLCNVGRTFLLCWVVANNGTGALSKWHDPAGFAILSICFFVLWGAYPFNFANSCETGAFKGIRSETVSSGSSDCSRRMVACHRSQCRNLVSDARNGGNTRLVFRISKQERPLFRCGDSGCPRG